MSPHNPTPHDSSRDPRHAEAVALCRRLIDRGYDTMLAGGCVRDRLLGLSPKDFDLATTASPKQTMQILRAMGCRAIPTGIKHGTVTCATPIQNIEITTLRTDVKCDGRHARVAFTGSFDRDAQRRDFTVNALFEDVDGHLHDFVGGLQDLTDRRLRFVGDARRRIAEDYLRIIRYFRFLSRLGWAEDPAALEIIRDAKEGLRSLSRERIVAELDALLRGTHAPEMVRLMEQCGVWKVIFEWYTQPAAELVLALGMLRHGQQPHHQQLRWFCLASIPAADPVRNAVARWAPWPVRRRDRRLWRLLAEILSGHGGPWRQLTRILALARQPGFDASTAMVSLAWLFPLLKQPIPWAAMTVLRGLRARKRLPPVGELVKPLPPRQRKRAVDALEIAYCLNQWQNPEEAWTLVERHFEPLAERLRRFGLELSPSRPQSHAAKPPSGQDQ